MCERVLTLLDAVSGMRAVEIFFCAPENRSEERMRKRERGDRPSKLKPAVAEIERHHPGRELQIIRYRGRGILGSREHAPCQGQASAPCRKCWRAPVRRPRGLCRRCRRRPSKPRRAASSIPARHSRRAGSRRRLRSRRAERFRKPPGPSRPHIRSRSNDI
jgi:hypothetical protein